MSEDSALQPTPRDLTQWVQPTVQSTLVARGRSDAAILALPIALEPEQSRCNVFLEEIFLDNAPTAQIRHEAQAGDARAQTILGFRHVFGWRGEVQRDEAASVRWYQIAAGQGYAPAQFIVGYMHDRGHNKCVKQDQQQAAYWYRKAADQGFAGAQFNLGVMYDKGDAVIRDPVEAVKWYRLAADGGFPDAQFNLALKYDAGEGVEKDHSEATNWYTKAANGGHAAAEFNLGVRFYIGHGVIRDLSQAHMWIALSISHAGKDDARRYVLARDIIAARMNTEQILRAHRLAVAWYLESAQKGVSWDQFQLGMMYERGLGVKQDRSEAAMWFRKAADHGHEEAQFNLGLKYQSGQGVERDNVLALLWLTLAAASNYEGKDVKYAAARDQLAANMTSAQIAEARTLVQNWRRR